MINQVVNALLFTKFWNRQEGEWHCECVDPYHSINESQAKMPKLNTKLHDQSSIDAK